MGHLGGHPGIATAGAGAREMGSMDLHSEFATGVDWCLFGAEGWCASTAWDERVLVWDVRSIMRP
jgi:peroxin-7